MSDSVVAVILAGGQGTRIRHLLPDLPKPMAPAAGRPFIEWVVRYLLAQGLGEIIISTGYKTEVIESHFSALALPGLRLRCVAEPEPLGTGGGFLHATRAAELPPDHWLVLNGDSLALTSLTPLFGAGRKRKGALLGIDVADAARYGTISSSTDGRITGFVEKRGEPVAGTINAGVYFFAHELLAHFPAQRPLSLETEIFPSFLARGIHLSLAAVPATTPFLDIGTPETLRQAETFIAAHRFFFFETTSTFPPS